MKLTTHHNAIRKTIIATYLDHNEVVWSFEAVVKLTRCNEVEHMDILWANNDEEAEFTTATWEGLVEFAGDRAMDKYEAEDFRIEEEA